MSPRDVMKSTKRRGQTRTKQFTIIRLNIFMDEEPLLYKYMRNHNVIYQNL